MTPNGAAGGKRTTRQRRRVAFAALVVAFAAWLVSGSSSDAGRISREYVFSGSRALFLVPAGVCRVRIEAAGASGGLEGAAGTPGLGARVQATLRVRPQETLVVYVGGQGGTALGATAGRGGWNGGGDGGSALESAAGRPGRAGSGGGGATDVRRGAGTLEDRILVAAGGGGGGGGGVGGPYGLGGGEGGRPTGADGLAPLGIANPVTGGRGGALSDGGAPAANASGRAHAGAPGRLGVGGDGAGGGVNGGGGGGGGLYGGGGGGAEIQWTSRPIGAGQGGGGSSFGPAGSSFRSGVWGTRGDGFLKIGYDPAEDACTVKATRSVDRPPRR